MPTLADYLKYANLQMAAEALFGFDATLDDADLIPGERLDTTAGPATIKEEWLTTGNLEICGNMWGQTRFKRL
jgi:hypothetical protein